MDEYFEALKLRMLQSRAITDIDSKNLVPHLTANNDTNFSYAHIPHL